MRWLRVIAAVVCCLGLAAPLGAEETKLVGDPARLAAARDLMEVTGVTRQLDGMIDAMSKGFAKGAGAESSEEGQKLSEEFQATMKKMLSFKTEMIDDFAVLYAETFTADEMKQVADFYRSGVGAKFIKLTPTLMQKGAAIGMKYTERLTKELPKPGTPEKSK